MICYFSATGNSKYVAERIAGALGDTAVSIVNAEPAFRLAAGERFGLVTPTYFWELPVPVRDFLSRLALAGGAHYVFLIATYGTTPGCCGEDARRVLKKRDIALNAAFSVRMPDTWTPIFDLSDPEKVAAQNRDAEGFIADVIARIQAQETGNRTERRAPYAVRAITDPLMNSARKTKHFYVEDSCIGCGLCARNCPVQAIALRDKKPVWVRERCALCLGCLHRCPKFAIQYGSGKTKLHGQYRNPNTSIFCNKDSITSGEIKERGD